MKILIVGGGGMLGHKLAQTMSKDFDVSVTIRGKFAEYEKFRVLAQKKVFENVDVLQFEEIKEIVFKLKPDVVINAVGIIKQLPISTNIINILEINSIFPHKLNKLAEAAGFRLLNISTDCVFSGRKGNYTEEDIPDAEDLYGKSKNLGETISDHSITLRTSIIGRELLTRHSLLEWFLSESGKKIQGYTNAVFSGFPTVILAGIIADLVANYKNLHGLFHVSSAPINKFDLLNLIKEAFDVKIEIEKFEDFYIDRSLDSSKLKSVTGFTPLEWEKMVEVMAKDQKSYLE